MTWESIDTWIVVAGSLAALSCALLGCFLVLRRMSMMGDAISHAVLPGLAIAFLLTESRSNLPMFVGAAIAGVLTALFTQWVRTLGKVDEAASMGVVFTTLFAIGLIVIVQGADRVDLDPGCVLYGRVELTPLDTVDFWGVPIPRAVIMLGVVFALNCIFVGSFYKELRISSFDPALATTLGINANVMHNLLMAMVAITTVAAFESVGSILVVAMLIVPAAAAHLLTDRLAPMLLVAAIIGVASAVLGHVGAVIGPGLIHEDWQSTSTAGMIAVACGAIFALAMLFAPRHGVVVRRWVRASLTGRIAREDLLGLLFRLEEHGITEDKASVLRRFRVGAGVGRFTAAKAAASLSWRGMVLRTQRTFALAPAGRAAARDLVRSHRLWELYLVRHLGLRPDHVHDTAMELEHVTDATMRDRLAGNLKPELRDPHGRQIP